MNDSLVDGTIVGDYKTIIFPFIAQKVGEQPLVASGGNTINDIKRRHKRTGTSLGGSLVRSEILVVHPHSAHIHRIVIATCLCSSIKGKMLNACHHILLAVVALESPHHSLSNATAQERVFACSLCHTSPTGIDGNVNHRTIHPIDTLCSGFLGGNAGTVFDSLDVPRTSLCKRNGKYRLIAMDNILPYEQWNTQPTLLYGNALQFLYLVLSLHIQYSSKLTLFSEFSQRTVYYCSCGNVVTRQEVELTDFLLKSHLRHEFIYKLIHRFLLGKC